MTKDAKAFRESLATHLGDAKGGTTDRRELTRVITLTTSKAGDYNPDDRLEQTEATITLVDARFVSWDAAASIYNKIDAGTLTLASTRGSETDLALAAPATAPVAASAGTKFTNAITTTQAVNESIQVESLTVSIEGNGSTMRIRRQGGPGVDLTGNVSVKARVRWADEDQISIYSIKGLLTDSGEAANPRDVAPTRALLDVGKDRDLQASGTMTYVMRHVTGGGGSLASGTQDVEEDQRAADPITFTLASRTEAYPQTFGLFDTRTNLALGVKVPGLEADRLCVGSYEEAEDLIRYLTLQKAPSSLGRWKIGWFSRAEDRTLAIADLERLQIRSHCARS